LANLSALLAGSAPPVAAVLNRGRTDREHSSLFVLCQAERGARPNRLVLPR
jgi:hypothetical protein